MGVNISLTQINSVSCLVFADWLFIFLRSLKATTSWRHSFCCANQQLNESVFEEGVKLNPKTPEVLLETDSLLHTAPLFHVSQLPKLEGFIHSAASPLAHLTLICQRCELKSE